jgi:NAD-dependent dihydropyrimidine dehydrogenase PreA subunit
MSEYLFFMNHIIIEPEECKGCRLCVEFCPKACIAMGQSINKMGYQYAEFNSEKCTACGICYRVCPEPGAITVFEEKKPVKTA